MSVAQVAVETGMTRQKARRWLRTNSWWVGAQARGFPPTYDARVIDVINAVSGREHRPITASGADWLSEYLKDLRGGPPHA